MAGPCAWSARTAAEVPGVSIMPVREAVSRLVAGKAFEVTPNRAVREPPMSAQGSSAEVNYLFRSASP
jgi:DNA-binding GntR family transcriptional regulator